MAGKLRAGVGFPHSTCRTLLCAVLLAGVCSWSAAGGTEAQALPQGSVALPASAAIPGVATSANSAANAAVSTPSATPASAVASQPAHRPHAAVSGAWNELSVAQQLVLRPLAEHWDEISEFNRRKWLNMAATFNSLPQTEQERLRARMTEWSSLSPQQRTQARLNFAKSRQLSPDERLAKWEAYQALPPEQKKQLAAKAPKRPVGAAPVLRPGQQKPAMVIDHQADGKTANRPALNPADLLPLLDPHTLLPRAPNPAASEPRP